VTSHPYTEETDVSATDATATPAELPCLTGHFHYADLHTPDVDGAQAFYGPLMGWSFTEIDGAPVRYVTAAVEDRGKAAIAGLGSEDRRSGGAPAYWFPYLWVDDLDSVLARVGELGGEVLGPAEPVFDMGRMASIMDPTGAALGLWEDAAPGATVVKAEHGSPFWYELHTTDAARAQAFYGELVGWDFETLDLGGGMQYHLIEPAQRDDQQRNAGGMMRHMQADLDSGLPSYWAVYLNVDDCDAAHARAVELGGTSVMEPHEVPGAGRSCWLRDPQGAVFAAMHPQPPAG
jgi:predicted enzyme related to lactoylglutathione lyase